MHRPVHPNHSMNEKLVVLKIGKFLTINYVIVLSSVLLGYGTFICFIQIKFKRKTFFSKFYFSNLVIC